MKISRRNLIKTGVFSAVGLGGVRFAAQAQDQGQADSSPTTRARNIIFFVYDGMTWEDYSIAQHYARRQLGRPLALERLMSLGTNGLMNTHSLISVVTDSAAASSAWSTGRKVVNGQLGMFPDKRELTPILQIAKSQGKAIGVITTTTVTHATPAGFLITEEGRGSEDVIAEKYLALEPNLILGGGARFFDPAARKDKKDMWAEFAKKGFGVVKTLAELQATNASRLLGTFSPGHVPYEIDRRFQNLPVPSLAQMVAKGLTVIANSSDKGFVLQIEAGRVDHAAHANDPAGVLWDMIAADEALEQVIAFVDKNPDTLLIVGSDHGTGSGAVYGIGEAYNRSSAAFDLLKRHQSSYEFALSKLGSSPSTETIIAVIEQFTGGQLSVAQAELVAQAIARKAAMPNLATHNIQPADTLAYVLQANDYDKPYRPNIAYASGQHTATPTMLVLYGAGARSRPLGLVDNTDLFRWMTQAMNVRFENPIMTEEEALKILATQTMPKSLHPNDISTY